MSDEVINLWIPIKKFDSESCYATFELDSQRQSYKEEETETKFKDSSLEVLLDNRSKFGGSSVDSVEQSDTRNGSSLCDFNEGDCGEPFVPQCLVFDFTPRPEDEQVSLKSRMFWSYVYSRPELKKYKMHPSAPVTTEDSDTTTTEEFNSKENEHPNTKHARVHTQAMNWLSEGKDKTPIITEKNFPTMKRCQKYCESYGVYALDGDATESETGTRRSRPTRKLQKLVSSKLSPGLSAISERSAKITRSRNDAELSRSNRWKFATETALKCHFNTRPQTKQVKAMCKEMASFDEAHPRNLDSPMHLSVQHAELRKIPN